MSTLVTINALAAARPTATASVQLVAAWYEHKAVVLRQITNTSPSLSERDTYRSFADQAYQHAVRLLGLAEDAGEFGWREQRSNRGESR